MCQDSNYFLSDILNYIDLVASKELELQMISGDFVKEAPKPKDPKEPKAPKKLELTITKKVMTAKEYKALLATQLQAMAVMDNEYKIELTVNN